MTKFLGRGDSDGTSLGQSAADLISIYGATPVTQPKGPAQAAVTRGAACGSICTFAISISPTAVGPNTTVETSITPIASTASWKVVTGTPNDLLYANRTTAGQAGLGVGGVRVSGANNVGLNFSNFTAATITPTTSQIYTIVALRGFGAFSPVLTPAAVAPTAIVEQQFTVAGVRAGGMVQVNKPTAQAGLDVMGCRVVSDNTIGITFGNVTASTITPTAGETYTVLDLAGIDAVDTEMVLQVNVGTVVSIATTTTTEAGITVTNINATDVIKGVSKPTNQAGLFVAGYRVSGAGALGITFGNTTSAGLTPTASEVYGVSLHRPNPVAPLLLYTQALTPVSVAANTCATQTFTVTGLISGTPVWVNKPSATAGLGIVSCRVSATNTLEINYGNVTAAAIVPPAETYTIGNFQLPYDVTGTAAVQTASYTEQQKSILLNAVRTGLVNIGAIAGA